MTAGLNGTGRIDEFELGGQGGWLLPGLTPDLVAGEEWLDHSAVDENSGLRLSVHSFLVEIAGQRIVVDTGVGNVDSALATRSRANLLAELSASETVLLGTHFTHPTGGWVRRYGNSYQLAAVNSLRTQPLRGS
ncbi:hypothetical protein ACIP5Y_28925 [Nocardia sp. NPDC088792]|uniref:hypothetical protein n=1 Tax=Nocardia sp. NPDC088792 TaxID=3364332 RepID=UPI00380BA613